MATTTQSDTTASPVPDPAAAVVVTPVRPRTGPALVVVGVAAAVVAGGVALAIAGGTHTGTGGQPLRPLPGVAIAPRSAAPLLARIARGGEPPADVARALVVPADATVTRALRPAPAVSLYSGTVTMSVPASVASVTTFFRRELASRHFSVLAVDATTDGRGTRIFARFPSSDGFYWEAAVEVQPAAASITPALGGAEATSTASLTVFEVDDAD